MSLKILNKLDHLVEKFDAALEEEKNEKNHSPQYDDRGNLNLHTINKQTITYYTH